MDNVYPTANNATFLQANKQYTNKQTRPKLLASNSILSFEQTSCKYSYKSISCASACKKEHEE